MPFRLVLMKEKEKKILLLSDAMYSAQSLQHPVLNHNEPVQNAYTNNELQLRFWVIENESRNA